MCCCVNHGYWCLLQQVSVSQSRHKNTATLITSRRFFGVQPESNANARLNSAVLIVVPLQSIFGLGCCKKGWSDSCHFIAFGRNEVEEVLTLGYQSFESEKASLKRENYVCIERYEQPRWSNYGCHWSLVYESTGRLWTDPQDWEWYIRWCFQGIVFG